MPETRAPAARLAWLVALFLVAGLAVHAAPEILAAKSGPDFQHAIEKQTFLLINQFRSQDDLPPLIWSDAIAKVARAHSKDMATGDVDFGHDGFRDRVDQLKGMMSGFRGAGENVLMTDILDEAPKRAVDLWVHSPHHLKNIRGDYNYSAIGVIQSSNGTLYFTQIFLKFE